MDDAPTTGRDLAPAPTIPTRDLLAVPIVVEAVYEDGVITPLVSFELPTGTPITFLALPWYTSKRMFGSAYSPERDSQWRLTRADHLM